LAYKAFFIIYYTPHYGESWQMDPFYPLPTWWVARLQYMENIAIQLYRKQLISVCT